MSKYSVMFFSTHNSCRSQISEALARILAGNVMEPFSAGLEASNEIDAGAARVVRELYGIDINETQKPKLFFDVPQVDVVIYFSEDVTYPEIKCKYSEIWNIGSLKDKPINAIRKSTMMIEQKIMDLKAKLESGSVG